MLAHFIIIPLFGHLRLMEREEVMSKAHECFCEHFQDHKITGRKGVRGLGALMFHDVPSQAQTVA